MNKFFRYRILMTIEIYDQFLFAVEKKGFRYEIDVPLAPSDVSDEHFLLDIEFEVDTKFGDHKRLATFLAIWQSVFGTIELMGQREA